MQLKLNVLEPFSVMRTSTYDNQTKILVEVIYSRLLSFSIYAVKNTTFQKMAMYLSSDRNPKLGNLLYRLAQYTGANRVDFKIVLFYLMRKQDQLQKCLLVKDKLNLMDSTK
jgi:hypothetical protein